MRIVLSLVFAISFANAGAFLDRFNALEQSVEELESKVATLKGGTAPTVTQRPSVVNTTPAKDYSKEIEALQKTIKALQRTQQAMKAELAKRPKATAVVVPTALAKAKPAAKEEEAYEEMDFDPEEFQEQIDELSRHISNIRKFTNGNALKWNADFRTSMDRISYTMADGSKTGNSALFTNRLWLDFAYVVDEHVNVAGQLAYNKAYGARQGTGTTSFDSFDWIANEVAYDDIMRVRSAYFFYRNETFVGASIPWTMSIGRRPSTNGHLINLRDDDKEHSPLAHSINVEFDGLSSKFDLHKVTGIEGMYFRICAGRGLTNATDKFNSAPYATNDNAVKDIDLGGFIFQLYNDQQVKIVTQVYKAWNLIDFNGSTFKTVGDLTNATVNFSINGLGEWSQFTDESIFFMSYSASLTDPNSLGMLGSTNQLFGQSYWVGFQFPTASVEGKFGLEWNTGTQNWRSITYAEDTMVGSKVAARGNAYEAYWTEPMINDAFSWQLRYTYINYDYAGSNGFFGSFTGTPTEITSGMTNAATTIEEARDIRFYIRYKY